jgi:hypothetical protein
LQSVAGATAAAAALRFGDSLTEGLELCVIDETVTLTNAASTNITNTVPGGAVILGAQGNLQTAVAGDASGDNGLVKIGIGNSGDPDAYGKSSGLTKNLKIDGMIAAWAKLGSAEQIAVYAVDTNGAAVSEKFVAGATVRVRVYYLQLNSLDNAA